MKVTVFLIAIVVLMAMTAACAGAGTFYGQETKYLARIVAGQLHVSVSEVEKGVFADSLALSGVRLLADTNLDTQNKKLAAGDKTGYAYSNNPIVSAMIEGYIDFHPGNVGCLPKVR